MERVAKIYFQDTISSRGSGENAFRTQDVQRQRHLDGSLAFSGQSSVVHILRQRPWKQQQSSVPLRAMDADTLPMSVREAYADLGIDPGLGLSPLKGNTAWASLPGNRCLIASVMVPLAQTRAPDMRHPPHPSHKQQFNCFN
eukprot:1267110-Amphidinium_carterae.1